MPKSYPLNILKVQSESLKISNLGQNFILTENCTPNLYPYQSFQLLPNYCPNQYFLPQNIFSQPKYQTPNYRARPPVFLTTYCSPMGYNVSCGNGPALCLICNGKMSIIFISRTYHHFIQKDGFVTEH